MAGKALTVVRRKFTGYPNCPAYALWTKIRDGAVANRPVCLAVGVDLDGCRMCSDYGSFQGRAAQSWYRRSADRIEISLRSGKFK